MARGGSANLLGAAVTALCAFALTVAVTRGVSRAEAGVFFSATSVFLVASTIGQLGTQTGLVYFLSRCRVLRRFDAMDAYLRTALWPVVTTAAAMTIVLLLSAHPLAGVIAPKHVDQATTYLRILAPFIPVVVIEAALLAATRGLGSMRSSAFVEQIGRPVAQLVLVTGAAFAASTSALGLAWTVAYLPALAAAWLAWRALRRKYPLSHTADAGPVFREFWKFTLPRALTSVIQMLIQRIDIVLVGALSGAVNAAVYAAATRFIVVGQLGTNALTLAAQPQLAANLARKDHAATNHLYQTSTAWLILITWPIYLTMILFAQPLLLVFGSGYSGGNDVMLLIALSMLVATGLGMVDTVLSMAGHTSWNLANSALALAVNLGLDFWLIPHHGIFGAAIGWAAAITVRNVAAATQVGMALHFHSSARSTVTAAVLTLACYSVVLGLGRLLLGATPRGLGFGLLVATGCYVLGLRALRGPLELHVLSGLRRAR